MPDTFPTDESGHIRYLVLGCGSIGYNVVQELAKETNQFVIIDRDEKRVEDLRNQDFNAYTLDIEDHDFLENIPKPEFVFVLSHLDAANIAAVKTVKKNHPNAYVIARSGDPISNRRLEKAGADIVMNPQEVFAQTALRYIHKLRSSRMARRLNSMVSGWEGTLGIVVHTNPDPDAISSAMALCAIGQAASEGKLKCVILYDGKIGHQENRAFVNLLDIQMDPATEESIAACSYLALVDSCRPGANNVLRPDTRVNIIVDHHKAPEDAGPADADFVDIRPSVGATASIMSQYYQELDIQVDTKVATALMYGIRADTLNFSRHTTPLDLHYAAFLLPLTDEDLLEQISSPSMSQETLDVFGDAIRSKKIISGYLFSDVGYVRNRDALPQAADLLIKLEGVNTALVYGITDEQIIMSARNKDIRMNVGKVLAEAFDGMGSAGGHASMAAAALPLSFFSLVKDKEELLSLIIEPILGRFMELVGIGEEEINEI